VIARRLRGDRDGARAGCLHLLQLNAYVLAVLGRRCRMNR
jgi:hypothetical protein